jgi:hypothetical protein
MIACNDQKVDLARRTVGVEVRQNGRRDVALGEILFELSKEIPLGLLVRLIAPEDLNGCCHISSTLTCS